MSAGNGQSTEDCVFCRIIASSGQGAEVVWQGPTSIAITCQPPKMRGHTLIIPRNHAEDVLELDYVAYEGLIHAAKEARKILQVRHNPAGFNFGANIGEAAGQTMRHSHFHLMPRYQGDCPEQRGVASIITPWHDSAVVGGVEQRPLAFLRDDGTGSKDSLRFTLGEGRNFPP